MRKRIAALIAAACLLTGILLVALPGRSPEPQYHGRSLSEWLRTAPTAGSPNALALSDEARDAVRHIGTNALPVLLRWISYDPSQFKVTLLRLPGALPGSFNPAFLHRAEDRALDAQKAFAVLGPGARAAIPELTRLAMTAHHEKRAGRCIEALGRIGPEALPALLAVSTNTAGVARHRAALTIKSYGTNAYSAVPVLIQLLQDPVDSVAIEAAGALGKLNLSASNAVPALDTTLRGTNSFRRAAAAYALAEFGPEAKAAVPQLKQVLADPLPLARNAAKLALGIIAPEVLTNAPAQ